MLMRMIRTILYIINAQNLPTFTQVPVIGAATRQGITAPGSTMVRHGPARRMSAALLVVCTTYLAVDTLFSSSPSSLMEDFSSSLRRELSKGLTTEEDPQHNNRGLIAYEECTVESINPPDHPIVPVFAASYPGSGSQMTHYLYEALTGVPAGIIKLTRGDDHQVISIKTHYPAQTTNVKGAEEMDRVILQLRNPLNALPSFASFRFEVQNGFTDHTVYAPDKFWIEWRDKNFDKALEDWVNHLEYWVDNYDNTQDKRIVISYENLINEETGPEETQHIAKFLGNGKGVTTVSPEIIPCVWDKVVNYEKNTGRKLLADFVAHDNEWAEKNGDKARSLIKTYYEEIDGAVARKLFHCCDDPLHPEASHRKGAHAPYTFTEQQLQTMINELTMIKERYMSKSTEDHLERILTQYVEEVEEQMKEGARG
mmetsp:Transcript_23136/g.34070  ORF Transcript_23136/g.34070 Transcript_23136/m.34070 type:complete len:426 (+) Transcript_23136:142-1419(+)